MPEQGNTDRLIQLLNSFQHKLNELSHRRNNINTKILEANERSKLAPKCNTDIEYGHAQKTTALKSVKRAKQNIRCILVYSIICNILCLLVCVCVILFYVFLFFYAKDPRIVNKWVGTDF